MIHYPNNTTETGKSNMFYNFVLCVQIGNDNREAKILTSVVLVFVTCQSFTIVADVYEGIICSQQNLKHSMCISNDHIENIIDISHFMISVNSSINFLLYAYHDSIFRKALAKVRLFHFVISIFFIQ